MASKGSVLALRKALGTLAEGLEDDVLEFVLGELAGCPEGRADDAALILESFIPGFSDIAPKPRQERAGRALKALKSDSGGVGTPAAAGGASAGSSSADAGEPSTILAAVAAAALEGLSLGGASGGGGGGGSGCRSSAVLAARWPTAMAAIGAGAPAAPVVSATQRPFVEQLKACFPGWTDAAALYALQKGSGRVEAAVDYGLTHDVPAEAEAQARAEAERAVARAAAERAAEEEARKRALSRFDEREDDSGKTYRPVVASGPTHKKGERVVRYVDGKAVHVRPGEKYLIEAPPEPPAGTVVALKIKRKGQGGASPGFR